MVQGDILVEKIDKAVDELISALSETDICIKYKEALKNISNEDMEMIKDFKNHRELSLKTNSYEDKYKAEELYRNIMLSYNTRNYMLCEKKILRVVTDIYNKIGEHIGFMESKM